MNGYAGKILRINLTQQATSIMPTSDYVQWGGGHGMGSAIFFELVRDKTIDGFDPANVVTIMTSPFCGTPVPAAGGRTEMQGIGVQSYPIGWFTRSNFGGRFSAMLKYAGWDGIVIEGRAEQPVWVDIRNDAVQIRACDGLALWGTDTRECQQRIWQEVAGGQAFGDWLQVGEDAAPQTTQRPAVLAIGPAGENLSRIACVIHDASNAAGQGGFGAVFGAKNLKAISVIGTGQIPIHDPQQLLAGRLWHKANYAFDLAHLRAPSQSYQFQDPPMPMTLWAEGRAPEDQRPQACTGCHSACRARYKDGIGNESSCFTSAFYSAAQSRKIQRMAADLINQMGLNAVELIYGLQYLIFLNEAGALGNGDIPACPLDFDDFGSQDFVEQFVRMIAYGDDGRGQPSAFGADISQGFVRAAQKWGRRQQDLDSGILAFPYWGLPVHKEPRAQVYWAYGTILGDRDINEHGFDWLKLMVYVLQPEAMEATTMGIVKAITDKMVPFAGDMEMLNFSEDNIYSEHMAKLVSWQRYYTRFWKQSMLFCNNRWPDYLNVYSPDTLGATGIAEPLYVEAVTGRALSFEDGIALGRKIWNVDHAIWTLQGRHRDMVYLADNVYEQTPLWPIDSGLPDVHMPGIEDGKWGFYGYSHRTLDREQFDAFKTRFYELQGWDPASGYPTRATLEALDLGYVADELAQHGRLGEDGVAPD